MIVYNIPSHQALDFIGGTKYFFKSDSNLAEDDFLQGFHLKPSRTAHHITRSDSFPGLIYENFFYMFRSKKIMVLEKTFAKIIPDRKIRMDIIIISRSPKLSINDLQKIFDCRQIIFDASNSWTAVTKWKAECVELNIPYYSVADKGAFVMIMN